MTPSGGLRRQVDGAVTRRWAAPAAAVGAVLAWFAVVLGPYVNEPPDLDAMVSLRESLVFHDGGVGRLVATGDGGVHPPLLDLVSSAAFSIFGEEARSLRFVSVALFAVVALGVERLLRASLPAPERVLAALAVAITPTMAINLFTVSREGLLIAGLVVALAIALPVGLDRSRLVALGLVLGLLPLIKETGAVLVIPFALFVVASSRRSSRSWATVAKHGLVVAAPAILTTLVWRAVLAGAGGRAWSSYVFSKDADAGSYVVAVRAILGQEDARFLRENLINGLLINFLWVPALLAVASVIALSRRSGRGSRRAAALVGGVALFYAVAILPFPTYAIPRYASPLTLLVLLVVLVVLPVWPRRVRAGILTMLLVSSVAGAWSSSDPVSIAVVGTTQQSGERIYDADLSLQGPDRIVRNLQVLQAGQRLNDQLRTIFASGATQVRGDCDDLKVGEKLYSIGIEPDAYRRAFPGARPLRCVPQG